MKYPRILFWHRKDLRINNNESLFEAFLISKSLTGIYIFDTLNNNDYSSKARSWFLGHTLKELASDWSKAGSSFLVDKGNPKILIPKIANEIDAKYVAWNKSIEPYEISRDEFIENELKKMNIKVIKFWDNLLVKPSQIYSGNKTPYTVYGPFYKKIAANLNNLNLHQNNNYSLKTISNLNDLEKTESTNQKILFSRKKLNDFIKNIDFKGSNICPCRPGEKGAHKLLSNFLTAGKITNYKSSRDFPYTNGTSFLSASLRFGTISIKEIWSKTIRLINIEKENHSLISIETWQKELIWREFYNHCLFNFPEIEQGPYRKKWNSFKWQNNSEWFLRWSNGETGVPIIDAVMRQLNETGWMHNRCRMIVASFLVKDLICNWQMGEKKFMELLVDGDVAANNGGWQWSASSGMDPKPLRIFNPYTQTQKFDPLCEYIKFWVPELKNVSNSEIIRGEILKIEGENYPSPIVNHSIQQRLFKTLYADI